MPQAPVNIGVGSEGHAFRQGIEKDVIPPIKDAQKKLEEFVDAGDDASDSLDDVGKAGKDSGKDLERSLKDAQQESDRTRHDIEDLGDAIKRTGRDGDEIGDGVKKGTREAGEAVDSFKQEAVQNMSETFSSFRGEAEDFAQIAQDTLGGVIGDLGPAGMAAGALGAIGIGLITAEYQRAKERAEELQEQGVELALKIIEAGGDIKLAGVGEELRQWATEASETANAFEFWKDKTQTNFEAIAAGADAASIDIKDMFAALTGSDPTQALDILESMQEQLDDVSLEYANLSSARMGSTERAQELREEKEALEDSIQVMEERTGVNENGIDTARRLAEATDEIVAADQAAEEAAQARTDAANALQSALDESVSSYQEYIDAETGAADPGAYMAAMQSRIDATTNFNDNVKTLAETTGLTMEEQQAILDQGVDFAPMLASIVAGGEGSMEQYAGLIQQIVGGGQEIADGNPLTMHAEADTDQANADLESTASAERSSTITGDADTSKADADLDKTASEKREAKITAKAEVTAANRDLNNVASKSRTASIKAGIDLSQATRDLNAWINTPRTTTITADVRDRSGRAVP